MAARRIIVVGTPLLDSDAGVLLLRARERGAAVGVLITAFVMLVLLGARFFGFRLSRERL